AAGQERGHPRLVEADADAVAGGPGLRHLEQAGADPEAVADADLGVGQALDGEVLAELTVHEVAAPQLLLPVPVGVELIHEDRAWLAAVSAEVALPVPLDVEPPDAAPPGDGILPDAGVHGPSAPFDVARHADVDGEQSSHRGCLENAVAGGTVRPHGHA